MSSYGNGIGQQASRGGQISKVGNTEGGRSAPSRARELSAHDTKSHAVVPNESLGYEAGNDEWSSSRSNFELTTVVTSREKCTYKLASLTINPLATSIVIPQG